MGDSSNDMGGDDQAWYWFGSLRVYEPNMAFAIRCQADWVRPWFTGDEAEHTSLLDDALALADQLVAGIDTMDEVELANIGKSACAKLDEAHAELIRFLSPIEDGLRYILEGHAAIAGGMS